MTDRIVWACDECRKPIADGDGYVTVSYDDLAEHEADERDYDRRMDEKYGPGLRAVTGTDFLTGPGLVSWRILHRDCDSRPDGVDYWIGVERIRSQAQALEWCAHLLGKNWIQHTDWARIARLAANAGKTARPVETT